MGARMGNESNERILNERGIFPYNGRARIERLKEELGTKGDWITAEEDFTTANGQKMRSATIIRMKISREIIGYITASGEVFQKARGEIAECGGSAGKVFPIEKFDRSKDKLLNHQSYTKEDAKIYRKYRPPKALKIGFPGPDYELRFCIRNRKSYFICSVCGQWKPQKNFGIDRSTDENVNRRCKECARKATAKSRAKNEVAERPTGYESLKEERKIALANELLNLVPASQSKLLRAIFDL